MCHKLVHSYFDINLDILWKTVSKYLQKLLSLLNKIYICVTSFFPEKSPLNKTKDRKIAEIQQVSLDNPGYQKRNRPSFFY